MKDYTEGHVRQSKALTSSGWATTQGLQRQMATLRVLLGKITLIVTDNYTEICYQEKSQHVAEGL